MFLLEQIFRSIHDYSITELCCLPVSYYVESVVSLLTKFSKGVLFHNNMCVVKRNIFRKKISCFDEPIYYQENLASLESPFIDSRLSVDKKSCTDERRMSWLQFRLCKVHVMNIIVEVFLWTSIHILPSQISPPIIIFYFWTLTL